MYRPKVQWKIPPIQILHETPEVEACSLLTLSSVPRTSTSTFLPLLLKAQLSLKRGNRAPWTREEHLVALRLLNRVLVQPRKWLQPPMFRNAGVLPHQSGKNLVSVPTFPPPLLPLFSFLSPNCCQPASAPNCHLLELSVEQSQRAVRCDAGLCRLRSTACGKSAGWRRKIKRNLEQGSAAIGAKRAQRPDHFFFIGRPEIGHCLRLYVGTQAPYI
ncbi:hypothetical protein A6R68_18893 [Neotoma lepida]|uniref:Uncharacterized protein n=1 Tax=Neotoma lepida TaxID=56216 RepID=A0A1A6HM19_NEOLE|nr:hypothetical protein A6R68_18893 [Neotoma lepida]